MRPSRAACGTRQPGRIAAVATPIRRRPDRRIVPSGTNLILTAIVAAKVWHPNDIVP